MTTPRDPDGDPPSRSGSGLPPHLDPRGRKAPPPPRVTNAYRQAARGGPAPTVLPAAPPPRGRPPKGRRTGGQRVARVLSWIALTMAVVVLVAAGGLWVAFNHYNGNIGRLDVFSKITGKRPVKVAKKAQNFLLVGSDNRDGANGEGTQGSGATFVTGQRSDTVILVHLFGNSDKAELISFPRDSWVEIPEFKNPKTGKVTAAHHNKLNSAFSEGGPPLLTATIETLTNIRIDHFLSIDFTGFKGMVNQVGGVDVCLTKAAKDHFSGIDLSAGHHHISGDVALAFVRQRHGLANGDIDRIARQQQFIGSLVHKVLSAGTLLNPLKLTGFLDVATSSLKADNGLSGNDIKNLALRLRTFNSGGVLFVTVPITDANGRRSGQSVVLLDETKDAAVFDALRNDQAPGTPGKTSGKTTTTPVTIAPANVRVTVFNGSGIQGKGRTAATDLAGVGFQIIGIPTNRGTGASTTTIFYGPTKSDSAHTLQAAIPNSVLQADSSLGRTLQVVVGSSYAGAQKVTVTAAPSSKPSTGTGTTSAAAPVKTAQDNPCTT
ncbi:MAG: cell envelope-related transcriptional attenuator [Frankiales bacterium]|nr:cell envelope-related transcriptional attenuator [Frankiales bacterium]